MNLSSVFRAPQDTNSGSGIELRLAGGRTSEEGRVEAKTNDGKSSYITTIYFIVHQTLFDVYVLVYRRKILQRM